MGAERRQASRFRPLLLLTLLGTIWAMPVEAATAASPKRPIPPREAPVSRDVAVAPVPGGGSPYAESWAVIVGINDYRHPRVPKLRYAVNDARAVERTLRGQGFRPERIRLLLDAQATKTRIEGILGDELRTQVGGNDRVLVFFAGHGKTDRLRSGEEEGYLLPVDGDPGRLFSTAISMTALRQISDRIPAKHILYVVDACYSGYALFNRSISDDLYEEMVKKPAIQILTAGRQEDQAQERGGHGIFTEVLVRGLSGDAFPRPKTWLALEELGLWVKQRVFAESNKRQLPQYGNLSGEGQFVFILPQASGPRVEGPERPPPSDSPISPSQVPPIALVPPSPPPRPATGSLVLSGTPPGTAVLLDGKEVGKVGQVPLRLEANAGSYTLRLEALGYKPREARIEVKVNTEQPIQFELERIIEGLRAGTIQRRGRDNAEMVYIPAGTFTMGDTHGDGGSDEKPTHQVTVEAFWIDRTEATNAKFARFVQASGYRPQGEWQKYAAAKDQHPVVEVTWHDAVAYCKWAEKRLATEAEFEYAARGTDGRKYPWGNTWEDTRARFAGNRGSQTTAPVGSYPTGVSPFGVLDMAGNVWEWVSSLYKPYPYVATDGREDPTASGSRVVRGSSWGDGPRVLRSADRGRFDPAGHYVSVGLRCAQGT